MSTENILCPNCESPINRGTTFCKNCGRSIHNYNKNIIQRLNDRVNLLALLLGFLVAGIFAFLGAIFYGLFLSNGIIDFIIYMGLVIVTMTFFGGLTVGIAGCSDYTDAKSNSLALLLIIGDIVAMIFGLSYVVTSGISGALDNAFGSSSNIGSSSSSSLDSNPYSSSGFDSQITNIDPDTTILFIVKFLIFGILTVSAAIGGCYLGVFLKKFVSEE